jgi:DNA-binding protein H-NS
MTAEERAWAVADQFRDWLQVGPSSVLFNQVVSAMTAAVREAEAAAAGRQRQRFLALIAEARSWWGRGNCPEVMETVQAALDQLRLAVMAGQPSDTGGGGSGGA